MRTKYTESFKREIVQKYEAMSPKPKQADFAKQHQLNLNSFQNWLHRFREKKLEFGIIELKAEEKPKQESKIPVHISLQNGVNIDAVLEESQFFDLIWQRP